MAYEYKGPVTYFEQIVPASVSLSRFAVAGDAERPYAATFCARSSNNPHGSIALTGIGVHDSTTAMANIWPLYLEGWALKGSHQNGVVAPEIAVINQRGTCTDINPYDMSPLGQINALRLGIGKPGCGSTDVSAFIAALHVEETGNAVARMGLVFGAWALKMINGIGRALVLARNHAIQWYSATGPTSMIVCDTADPSQRITIRLGNGALHFEDANGQSQFSFNVKTGALYLGAGGVGPNGTLRLFAAGQPYLIKATPERLK